MMNSADDQGAKSKQGVPESVVGQDSQRQGKARALTVLIVEDNLLIAENARDILEDCGCTIVGPASNVERGLRLVQHENLDGAFLDINLAGDLCFPIALALQERGIPFVFLTGYDDERIIPDGLRSVRRLSKPFEPDDLSEIVTNHFRHMRSS